MTKATQLDVIIPVYNEAPNLQTLVSRLHTTLSQAKITHQLIFVDDHSTDKTAEILTKLSEKYPIKTLTKKGQRGKAYSIIEGANASKAPYLAMIDADLQYPPEVLPAMFQLTNQFGVVVAKRNRYQDSKVRQISSRSFQWLFGKVINGLDCDVQSGLKVFKRDIISRVTAADVTPWTLDIPLLTTALNLGYSIGQVDITFSAREKGESKIKLLTSIKEIGGRAITYKLKRKTPFRISPEDSTTMRGAGVIKKGKQFVTHTTLEHQFSALDVITPAQKTVVLILVAALAASFTLAPFNTAKGLVAILSAIYFSDVFFNLYVILKSLNKPPEIIVPPDSVSSLKDKDLPIYTVLCPLYKEAHVLPQFLENISHLDWPKAKLDVILLLEEDDKHTVEVARSMKLPSYVTIQVVPDSQPKTKPKACNYGLSFAKGEYLVIYDAEDNPDPLQLKKVYLAFQKSAPEVKCIQAKLNFYNPHQNLLTRFFTAEYSLWFDVILTGLQSIQTSLPLGGTSNHFRTQELKALEGWDPFNVTEDADLGVRLFKRGALTAIIDSVTLEEANSSWHNWLRQRSRWIKGYMQTYLVHMRNPIKFFREYGWHAALFQLIVGGKIAFMLINPFMWILTITYFGLYAWLGPSIEALFPSAVFYMAVTSLLLGNFLFLYYYMIGAAKREHWTIIKWVFLVPIYWLMVSVAAGIALYELIVKPHYWQKTVHGLNLNTKQELEQMEKEVVTRVAAEAVAETVIGSRTSFGVSANVTSKIGTAFYTLYNKQKAALIKMIKSPEYRGAFLLVAASMAANVFNTITNFYLGGVLKLTDFAILNTFLSLSYLAGIVLSGISSTVNHKTALIAGKHQLKSIYNLWEHLLRRIMLVGLMLSIVWLFASPFLNQFLKLPSIWPVIIFAPFLCISAFTAINNGYLRGILRFDIVAVGVLIESLTRLILSLGFGHFHLGQFIYLTIPISAAAAWLPTLIILFLLPRQKATEELKHKDLRLPFSFFILSILSGLASIAFFSLDNILVVHFLGADEAGKYALLGLLGKMIYFAGSLVVSFVLPLISYKQGQGQKTESVFAQLFYITTAVAVAAYIGVIFVIPVVAHNLFGDKISSIHSLLAIYGLGVLFYTLSQTIVQYYLAKRSYVFSVVSCLLAGLQIGVLYIFHATLSQVVYVMSGIGIFNLVVLIVLHYFSGQLKFLTSNIQDFIELFGHFPRLSHSRQKKNKYRILIFNWRDQKHVWAGGAEMYLHNLAKQLVAAGHEVTIFSGNDGKSARNEEIDGIKIYRHGGFYTVYFWAMIYYVARFRTQTDLVIDSENGIPFLTPLYVRKPIYLLIHHIHQDVFREHLHFPFSEIASVVESDIMPWLYRKQTIITVSQSSKEDIVNIGLGTENTISVINPGIDLAQFNRGPKTKQPSIVYVGRLKPYKNIDVAIKAMTEITKTYPKATLTIAGDGESAKDLKKLTVALHLEKSVKFTGKITDQEKNVLLSSAWLAVQPSMVEGWGITVIEANASGTPVVASDVKGLRDSVVNQKTGILVKPQNNQELAAAIINLLGNKKALENMSNQAHQWAQRFDWPNSATQFFQVIERSFDQSAPVVTNTVAVNVVEEYHK